MDEKISRRDVLKLLGLAVFCLAGCTPTGKAVQSFATATNPSQSSSQQNVPNSNYNEPNQVLSILADEYVLNRFNLDIWSQPVLVDGGGYVPAPERAYELQQIHQNELEKAIHDQLNFAVRMGEIIPGPSGWQGEYVKYLGNLGDSAFLNYKATMGLNSAKIMARLGIAATPADVLFDLGDLIRGEVDGKDIFGFPMNGFDKALNSASVLLALGSLDAGDDINDLARAVRYAATNGGDDVIYVTKTGNVMQISGAAEKAIEITRLQEVATETIQNARHNGNLIIDVGTGTKVAPFSVGNAFNAVPGTPTMLTIDPSSAVWKAIASDPISYIRQVQTSVVGAQDAVSSLADVARQAPYSRAIFPNRNLMALCLDSGQLGEFARYGSSFQATYNLTPLLRTAEFGNMPLDLARHLYGVNGVQDALKAANMFEEGADASRASQILGDLVGTQRPRPIPGGADFIGPQYQSFVDAVTSGNHIPDYFGSLNVPGLRTARLLTVEEVARLNTNFAALTQAGARTLPQYIIEIIP